jgi:hypothetical protein
MSTNGAGPRSDGHDEALEGALRTAMRTEADTVVPAGDGLARIREGIERRRPRVWWQLPSLALAAAAVVGLLVGVVALGLRDEDHGTTTLPPANQHSSSPSPTPSQSRSTQPSPTPTQTSAATETSSNGPVIPPASDVWVYYLMDNGQAGVRLYREQHLAPTVGGAVQTALTEMLQGSASDPDYTSVWPGSTKLLHYSTSGDLATVNLSAFPTVGGEAEDRSAQQVVYTVTANNPSIHRVKLLVNGATPPSGAYDWSQPVQREPMLDVQGLVWILAPEQGAKVGSPVTVNVYGTGYEGNVVLKVFRGTTEVDAKAVTTAQGQFASAQTTFTLPPGDYRVVAYNDNGQNANLDERDSKAFTVK